MSTRRARIKAVTSLPPRRKNADKPNETKDIQIPIKSSPKVTAESNEEDEKKNSKSPPAFLSLPSPSTLRSKINSPLAKTASCTPKSVTKTPKLAEKVSVITSASSLKSVFASPQPRTDSPLRHIMSPLVSVRSTPKIVNLEPTRAITPQTSQTGSKEKLNNNESQKIIVQSNSDSEIASGYNIPSVPERNISEDAVMDGIVPLQPTRNAPKPIDLLKNEIISENAEVLFDPIVPLPSPSKVRPKLRPVPRLAPLRRNSIQGSASESEDESRRALLSSGATTPVPPRQRHDSHTSHSTLQSLSNRDMNRMRNDSVSSSISQIVTQPPPATSPTKEKQFKTRRQEISRRMAAMRRRRETVKRDALTMYDLIFYNPTTNPIIPDQDEIRAKEANKKDQEEREAQDTDEDPDDPPANQDAPVPQIKLGPNGEIILDETSLVIKQTDSKRKVSSVVREGAWGSGGGKYTRSNRAAEWSSAETVRFYRALAAIGTDFTLMAPLFPDRNRRELKIKFKKEERVNGAQVDKALRSATTWDAVQLQKEFEEERAEAAKKEEEERQMLKQQRQEEARRLSQARQNHVRRSRASKAVETNVLPNVPTSREHEGPITANEIIQRALEEKLAASKKRKENAGARKQANVNKTPYATLTRQNEVSNSPTNQLTDKDMATLTRVEARTPTAAPINLNNMTSIPPNIESGSLVVLTVNDPNSPSKKMLQTYIAHGAGRLTPVALPPNFLSTVVGYMKKGTPKSNSTGSPQLISPVSTSSTPGVIQLNPSPAKRQRHSSYTITQL
ncbi:unnamed protein product [Diatraea saccharalis]|uniref:Transcription factor TFIIIB component B'' Myb domain-containing protein n=1 Tax=Diatraea saccharalis TaxID=40085 RepID=A0A9N9RDP1_9NEOP|nr:unnamed protein product [Diatraea saccharalis]